MSDEKLPKKEESVELFLHLDRKIENTIAAVTELMKKDLGLDHKMDLVVEAQKSMQEGFGHSRETGHKTWEAVNRLIASIEKNNARIDNQQVQIAAVDHEVKEVEDVNKWIIRGIIGAVFLFAVSAFLMFLWRH